MQQLSTQVGNYNQPTLDFLDTLRYALLNRATSSAGIQIGTSSKAAVRVNATTAYLVDGVFGSKSAAEVAFTATTHDIPASASSVQERCYLVEIDSGGTLSLNAGEIATGSGAAKWPTPTATKAVLGGVRIAIAAGSTPFDASTDELDESHITDTYYSFGCPPLPSFDGEI